MIQCLDHVAIVVADTERTLEFFRDRLGLEVVAVDEPTPPALPVRLTYLATGSIPIQLVEPLDPASPVGEWLAQHGEGLHHICFAADDLHAEIQRLAVRHRIGTWQAGGLPSRRATTRDTDRAHAGIRPSQRRQASAPRTPSRAHFTIVGQNPADGYAGGSGMFMDPPRFWKPGDTVRVTARGIGELGNPVLAGTRADVSEICD